MCFKHRIAIALKVIEDKKATTNLQIQNTHTLERKRTPFFLFLRCSFWQNSKRENEKKDSILQFDLERGRMVWKQKVHFKIRDS